VNALVFGSAHALPKRFRPLQSAMSNLPAEKNIDAGSQGAHKVL
jgi:hypothetical protein